KSAQTFLSEIRWEKNITLGEPPGFLHSWWCVFWDLYCAAPDRRDTCDHSSEAKAFHDYVSFMQKNLLPFWESLTGIFLPWDGGCISHSPSGADRDAIFLELITRVENSRIFLSSLPFSTQGPPGGAPPGTPIMPSPGDSTNSSENMYTIMNPIGGGGNRPGFPMGPGGEGPMGGMPGMEPHHMNGTLGMSPLPPLFFPQNSPNNMTGINNPPGTPRDDGEMGGNFLNPFQSESYSPSMTMSV
uniref:Single stranded DNA binding protein 4 n=1 Tax=Callorhinchus milii TaxID=7868 RepID=A0A4W3H3R4_CALMI